MEYEGVEWAHYRGGCKAGGRVVRNGVKKGHLPISQSIRGGQYGVTKVLEKSNETQCNSLVYPNPLRRRQSQWSHSSRPYD